jgi:hypothetical protein
MPEWLELWMKALVLLLVVLLVMVRCWMTLLPERGVVNEDGSYAGWIEPE